MDLAGASALVTGASGGIGNAIARALAARGVALKLSARRVDVLEQLCGELGATAEALPADLADRGELAALIERASDVDVLVANAALPASGVVEDFTPEEIDRALEVNLRAPMQMARALLPGMRERGRGHLLFISSLSGKVASPGSAIYSATKFGMRGFALGLRQDLHDSPVGVTTVFPGFIRGAGMFADSGAKLPPGVGTRTPEQVAAAVVRGIERDRGEISVAPPSVRAISAAGVLMPGASAAVQRRLGGAEVSAAVAKGQREKR